MKRFFSFAAVAFVACAFSVSAEEKSASLSKGDKVAPFYVVGVNGDKAGEKHCYRCQYGNSQVCCIFTNEMTDTTIKAIKDLDKKLGENKDLKAFVVYCAEDTSAAETKLKEVAKKEEIKNIPLTVFDGKAGPPAYKLEKDAATTLMCWKEGKIERTKTYAAGKFCNECCGSQVAAFLGEKETKAAN